MQNKAAFLAVTNGDQILLVRSKTRSEFEDKWSLPGGVIEDGESFEEGAEREVLEETGVIAKAKECFKVIGEDTNLLVKLFKADYTSGAIAIDSLEIHEARWFKLYELKGLELAYGLAEDLTPFVL